MVELDATAGATMNDRHTEPSISPAELLPSDAQIPQLVPTSLATHPNIVAPPTNLDTQAPIIGTGDDDINALRGEYGAVREERARLTRLQELVEKEQRLKDRIERLEGSGGACSR